MSHKSSSSHLPNVAYFIYASEFSHSLMGKDFIETNIIHTISSKSKKPIVFYSDKLWEIKRHRKTPGADQLLDYVHSHRINHIYILRQIATPLNSLTNELSKLNIRFTFLDLCIEVDRSSETPNSTSITELIERLILNNNSKEKKL
jgi:hypothetical protein